MKELQFIKEIKSLNMPVFSIKEASTIIKKDNKYTSLYLSRLTERGEVGRIEKDKYYIKGTNPYAIASNIVYPSYLSMMSAFDYYKITTQNLSVIDIMTNLRHSVILNIDNYKIIFNKIPRRLMFGFYRSKEDGTFVAYIEKAIIDAILIGNLPFPYIEEAYENAKENGLIDESRLLSYANRINSKDLDIRINELNKVTEEKNRPWS